jgi:hypothetical protein
MILAALLDLGVEPNERQRKPRERAAILALISLILLK